MEKRVLYSGVHIDSGLPLHDLTLGTSLSRPGRDAIEMTIVESGRSGPHGSDAYAIVRCGTNQNGEPKYEAYASNQKVADQLIQRRTQDLMKANEIATEKAFDSVLSFCENSPKPKQEADFNLDKIWRIKDGVRFETIYPEDIKIGDHLHIGIKGSQQYMNIGSVRSFEYGQGMLAIESRSMITTNIEYERAQQIKRDVEEQQHHSGETQNLWGQENPNTQIPTAKELFAVQCAQSPAHYMCGPMSKNIVCIDTMEFVNPEDMQPGMRYQVECNLVNMRNGVISSGTLEFALNAFVSMDGITVMEPYADAKLTDQDGRVSYVNGVLSTEDFSVELQQATEMMFGMDAIAWGEYRDNFIASALGGKDELSIENQDMEQDYSPSFSGR